MKTIHQFGSLLFLILFFGAGNILQAQQSEEQLAREKAMQEEMEMRKQMLEEQQEHMKEMEIQFAEQSREMEERSRESSRARASMRSSGYGDEPL